MNLERAVQLCVDIASHILSDAGGLVPDTMAGTFQALATQGILDEALGAKLKKSVGFRNIAIHQYQDINHKILFAVITEHLQDFKDFAKAILVLQNA